MSRIVQNGVFDERTRVARAHGYETPRVDVQAHVPLEAQRILEIGCSVGALGEALKQRQDCCIVGIEISPEYAAEAERKLDRVIVGDALEVFEHGIGQEPFDCLIAADVLEHVVDPWSIMRHAAALLSPGATAIISLPNVLHYRGLWRLVRRLKWPMDDEGVFDRTHLRWFAPHNMTDLLLQAGLEPICFDPRYWVEGAQLRQRQLLAKTKIRPFLAPQYVISARKI